MLNSQRLETLLSLLSSLQLYDVVSISELAKQLSVDQTDLEQDLDILSFAGIPPFGGGDLLPVEIEDGYLCVTGPMPTPDKPLRLSNEEATALSLALSIAGFADDDPLRTHLDSSLAHDFDIQQLHGILYAVRGRHNPQVFRALSAALRNGQTLRMSYINNDGIASTRVVAPTLLFAERDLWYLRGQDSKSGEERNFRVDRIQDIVALTDDVGDTECSNVSPNPLSGSEVSPEKIREGVSASMTASLTDAPLCRIRFSPPRTFLPERWPQARVKARGSNWLEIDLPYVSDSWVARRVVACHGQATVCFPADLRAATARLAKELLVELFPQQ
ncbi:MAG: WYL domain-containing protein [Actinomycetes bacterium]|jgi:predicted DNA-binding transcriptional regulator YafY|nr:WYL domain-containing protein [Actinomycetes bacterium]